MSINRSLYFTVFILSLLFFPSCETDIDVIAPKRDVTVIYGLLEADKTRHYIKINRAFVGEDSASVLASEPGINEYNTKELSAVIVELGSDAKTPTGAVWTLNETYSYNKEGGAFFNDSNKVYYFDAQLDATKFYRIECTVNVDGEDEKKVTATTDIIGLAAASGGIEQVRLLSPALSGNASSTNGGDNRDNDEVVLVNGVDYASQFKVSWSNVTGGVLYTSYFRIYYREYDVSTGLQTGYDSVTLNIGSRTFDTDEQVNFPGVNTEDYFATIGRRVDDLEPANISGTQRIVSDTVQFFLEVASEELATYIEVNQPISGVVQERPTYTNVNNGIGIFASRVVSNTKRSSILSDGRILDANTLEELLYSEIVNSGDYTKSKSFTRPGRCVIDPETGPDCQ
jgi:hypothetical protein